MSILNVKLLQLFIMEMRTLACGFVFSGCSWGLRVISIEQLLALRFEIDVPEEYMVNLGVYSNLVLQFKR